MAVDRPLLRRAVRGFETRRRFEKLSWGESDAVRRGGQGDTLRVRVKVKADVVTRPMCAMRPRQQQWDKASILCCTEGSVSRVE
jgi:hypothetical protein